MNRDSRWCHRIFWILVCILVFENKKPDSCTTPVNMNRNGIVNNAQIYWRWKREIKCGVIIMVDRVLEII